MALYDRIGRTYAATRTPDPRLARAIRAAIGEDVGSLVNVGAGTGAYEPDDVPEVIAVEPSAAMRAQRRDHDAHDAHGAARVRLVDAHAEHLPLADDSVDVALTVLSDHHWADRAAGLRELARVARKRVVLVNSEPDAADAFWLTRHYLPAFHSLIPERFRVPGAWRAELRDLLGPRTTFTPLPIPHDCADGFYPAYWRRPHAYLDPAIRDNISVFHRVDHDAAMQRLARDLDSGAWHHRHHQLTTADALDAGLRIVVADLA